MNFPEISYYFFSACDCTETVSLLFFLDAQCIVRLSECVSWTVVGRCYSRRLSYRRFTGQGSLKDFSSCPQLNAIPISAISLNSEHDGALMFLHFFDFIFQTWQTIDFSFSHTLWFLLLQR